MKFICISFNFILYYLNPSSNSKQSKEDYRFWINLLNDTSAINYIDIKISIKFIMVDSKWLFSLSSYFSSGIPSYEVRNKINKFKKYNWSGGLEIQTISMHGCSK